MLFTSDDIETIISKLNSLLMSGHILRMSLIPDYQMESKKPDFLFQEWFEKKQKLYNDWYRDTAYRIDEIFSSNQHYLFHFLYFKGSALSFVGIHIDLSNLLNKSPYALDR